MKFGLEQHTIDNLVSVFEQHSKVDKAIVFGSRAKGNYRADSDIDIAIKGQDITTDDIISMSVAIEEKGITNKIDLINYHTIKEPDLREHINRVGIELYCRWKRVRLEEVSTVQTGPFGSQLHMSDYKVFGTPIITVEHLGENRIIHNNLPMVSDEDKQRLIKYTLREGDIVFSRVGSVDRRAYVSDQEEGWMFSGRCLRVRVDKEKVNPKFLSFYFGQESFKENIRRIAVGATMPSINTTILNEIEVVIPPLDEQHAISAILSSLDDKIELLQRQNKTLEQLAETLFRQWFVEEAEESWEIKKIAEVAAINQRSISKDYSFDMIEYLDTGSITEGKIESFQRCIRSKAPSRAQRLVSNNDIVYSLVRPIQRHYGLLQETKPNMVVSTGFCVITATEISPYFLYVLLTSDENVEFFDMVAEASTSAYPSLKPSDLGSFEFQLPPKKKLQDFNIIAESNWQKIKSNFTQIQALSQLRDALLPKLMSGEVRVQI